MGTETSAAGSDPGALDLADLIQRTLQDVEDTITMCVPDGKPKAVMPQKGFYTVLRALVAGQRVEIVDNDPPQFKVVVYGPSTKIVITVRKWLPSFRKLIDWWQAVEAFSPLADEALTQEPEPTVQVTVAGARHNMPISTAARLLMGSLGAGLVIDPQTKTVAVHKVVRRGLGDECDQTEVVYTISADEYFEFFIGIFSWWNERLVLPPE